MILCLVKVTHLGYFVEFHVVGINLAGIHDRLNDSNLFPCTTLGEIRGVLCTRGCDDWTIEFLGIDSFFFKKYDSSRVTRGIYVNY